MLAFDSFSTLEFIGFSVILISLIIQLIYYWFIFGRLAFHKNKNVQEQNLPVSIVISAKNEYYNLKENLPIILNQDYPDYEVVVVNHASTDDTEEILSIFSHKYPHLKVVNIRENLNFYQGKKFPLSIGIKSTRHEYLLLTDADCKPESDQWLREMQGQFDEKTEIVLGYSPYAKSKGVLNSLVRWDTLHIGIQYLSYALSGIPYMGVGRNLAYRKSTFMKNNGFVAHYNTPSGDDDLFIGQVARKHNTRISVNKTSQTSSRAKSNFSSWFKQKRRHLTTGKLYRPKFKALLGLYSLSQTLFYLSLVYLCFVSEQYYLILGIFLIRMLSQLFLVKKCMNRLGEKLQLIWVPLYDFFFTIMNPVIAFSNVIWKDKKWK